MQKMPLNMTKCIRQFATCNRPIQGLFVSKQDWISLIRTQINYRGASPSNTLCFFVSFCRVYKKIGLAHSISGTSKFIKRQALIKWGQWDAHNVTEDADLGIRLFRHDLRVECLDSTTYEEANYKFGSWVKQRSRWLKGFILTWLTHMRAPQQLI